jgi:hypothetical protein
MTCPIWLGPRYESQKIIELTRAASARERISYEHHRHAEPMLAIPDAIARCWSKGGIWRRRIRPIVSDVMKVQAAQIARSPSATVVRPGLGLTSWSSTLQTPQVCTTLCFAINRFVRTYARALSPVIDGHRSAIGGPSTAAQCSCAELRRTSPWAPGGLRQAAWALRSATSSGGLSSRNRREPQGLRGSPDSPALPA